MTEQELISSAVIISVFVTPICTFFNVKLAWKELEWFIFFFLGLVSIELDQFARVMKLKILYDGFSKRRLSKASVCKAIVMHGILMLWGIYFTIWGVFFTYECAKYLINLIFGG